MGFWIILAVPEDAKLVLETQGLPLPATPSARSEVSRNKCHISFLPIVDTFYFNPGDHMLQVRPTVPV